MKVIQIAVFFYLPTILVVFYSCHAKQPVFLISKDYEFVEEKNNSPIRAVAIEQYDTLNNFIGKKNIYKNLNGDGKSKIYFFLENEGYHFNGDTLRLSKGFVYKLHIETLGFSDTLVFRP
ncbi:hypothetical protein QTN47_15225 [Danxiaibacter flavus]|uniref:Uncharacterized protein n=1 Tax=Danxiaibacter flavus TaxID=3049108 RepID=A0ABV3ZGC0_9BACT|nr:hypothetical protein QNM32_15235 [Chitinophagaceae bacterium DXS]